MDINEATISLQQKTIKNLKAELTYWKETADYWKNVAFEFERHNKHLKELNKTLDK